MKLSLFYTTFDGVDSFYCGIGALGQYFLSGAGRLRERFARHDIEIDVTVLYSRVASDGSFYSEDIATRSRALAAENGVGLHQLASDPGTANPFGTHETWPSICQETVDLVGQRAPADGVSVLLANDTPFAGVLPCVSGQPFASRVMTVWLVQSTAKLWAHPELLPLDAARAAGEQRSVDAAATREDIKLGPTSHFMSEHLRDEYRAAPDTQLLYRAGVDPDYLRRFYRHDERCLGDLDRVLRLAGSRDILLCFGRAAWYKGMEVACDVARRVASTGELYPVICMSDYGTADSAAVIRSIRRSLPSEQAALLLIDRRFDLPKYLLQLPQVCIVLVPSLRENLSAIPSEARLMGAGRSVVVASARGGLIEQFDDRHDGFLCDPEAPGDIESLCREIAGLDDSILARISEAGRQRALQDLVLADNLWDSLRRTLSDWDAVPDAVRSRLRGGA